MADVTLPVQLVVVVGRADGHRLRLVPVLRRERQLGRCRRQAPAVGGRMDGHVAGGRRVQDHRVGGTAALLDAELRLAHRHPGAVVVGDGDGNGGDGDPGVAVGAADRVAEGGGLVRCVAVVGGAHGHGLRRLPVVGGEGEARRLCRHVGVVAAHRDRDVARGPAVEHHRVAGTAAFRDRHRVGGSDRDAAPSGFAPCRARRRASPFPRASWSRSSTCRSRRRPGRSTGPARCTPCPASGRVSGTRACCPACSTRASSARASRRPLRFPSSAPGNRR